MIQEFDWETPGREYQCWKIVFCNLGNNNAEGCFEIGENHLNILEVASIGAGAKDEANPALGLPPGGRHQAACRVVQDRHHLCSSF